MDTRNNMPEGFDEEFSREELALLEKYRNDTGTRVPADEDLKDYLYDLKENLEAMLIGHIVGQTNYSTKLLRYLELKRTKR